MKRITGKQSTMDVHWPLAALVEPVILHSDYVHTSEFDTVLFRNQKSKRPIGTHAIALSATPERTPTVEGIQWMGVGAFFRMCSQTESQNDKMQNDKARILSGTAGLC